MKHFIAAAAILGVFPLVSCEEKSPQPPLSSPKPVAPTTPSAPEPTQPAKPQDPAPVAAPAAPPAAAPAGAGQELKVMGVTFMVPAGWNSKPPSNQMRLAEVEVPGTDASNPVLIVFSSAGGSVDDNLARWSGQVRDDAGQPVPGTRDKRTVGGLEVTTIEMAGSYAGMGDSAPKPNFVLRGAIVQTSQGLLFIKMTGPEAQMQASKSGFEAMVNSLKAS